MRVRQFTDLPTQHEVVELRPHPSRQCFFHPGVFATLSIPSSRTGHPIYLCQQCATSFDDVPG